MSENPDKDKSHATRFPTSGVDISTAFLEKLVDPFLNDPSCGFKSRPELVKAAIREYHTNHAGEIHPRKKP